MQKSCWGVQKIIKTAHFKKTLTKIKIEQLLLFLARIVVYCSENRAREGGCPGASGHWNRLGFETGEAPFFEAFFGTPFFTEISEFKGKWLPKWYHFWSLFGTFLEEGEYAKIVLGLEREPFRASFRGSKNHKKHCTFTNTYFTTLFFEEKIGKSAKNDPNMGPKT